MGLLTVVDNQTSSGSQLSNGLLALAAGGGNIVLVGDIGIIVNSIPTPTPPAPPTPVLSYMLLADGTDHLVLTSGGKIIVNSITPVIKSLLELADLSGHILLTDGNAIVVNQI
jgi:hypothetical protein